MDIKAPDLGVDSAEVSEIMVEVGDVIAKDDNIILLESDKASVEVPCSAAGNLFHSAGKPGPESWSPASAVVKFRLIRRLLHGRPVFPSER